MTTMSIFAVVIAFIFSFFTFLENGRGKIKGSMIIFCILIALFLYPMLFEPEIPKELTYWGIGTTILGSLLGYLFSTVLEGKKV